MQLYCAPDKPWQEIDHDVAKEYSDFGIVIFICLFAELLAKMAAHHFYKLVDMLHGELKAGNLKVKLLSQGKLQMGNLLETERLADLSQLICITES